MRRVARRAARRAAEQTLLGIPVTGARSRAALTIYLIFAAALQGVLAQGHVHSRWEAPAARAGVILDVPLAPGHDGGPLRRDETTTCALCQVLAAGSAPFVHAVGHVPSREVTRWSIADERVVGFGGNAVSYNWTSRGPPSV
jgi:hypothetical protein